jgi:hypothetical protein
MNNQHYLPDPSVDKRLIGNLRLARLEMEEIGLELEEVIAKLDEQIRQQKSRRIKRSLDRSLAEL